MARRIKSVKLATHTRITTTDVTAHILTTNYALNTNDNQDKGGFQALNFIWKHGRRNGLHDNLKDGKKRRNPY